MVIRDAKRAVWNGVNDEMSGDGFQQVSTVVGRPTLETDRKAIEGSVINSMQVAKLVTACSKKLREI